MFDLINRKSIYKNPWLEVIEDKVKIKSGEERTFTTVSIKPGVTILAVDENQNTYLSNGFQYALNKSMIGATAGGGIDEGETPLEAAKRELKEETGFTAKEWKDFGSCHAITAGIISSPNHLFLATELQSGTANLEDTESIQTQKVPLETVVEKVMSGEITHSASALLIMKAWNSLH